MYIELLMPDFTSHLGFHKFICKRVSVSEPLTYVSDGPIFVPYSSLIHMCSQVFILLIHSVPSTG